MPSAGDIVHASDVIQDTWTSYNPSWTATVSNPSIGTGTLTGRYMQVGSLVWVFIKMTAGSTTTFGSGLWRFSLPVTPAVDALLPSTVSDNSTSFRYPAMTRIILSSTTGDNMRIHVDGGYSGVSSTAPFTWANGDFIIIAGHYMSA
jgi:hypothetical protein